MIAVLEATHPPPAKRQKRAISSPPLLAIHDDGTSSLGGIEDHYSDDDEEDRNENFEQEELFLDQVLVLYEKLEEESLMQQSQMRCSCNATRGAKSSTLKKKLQDEKVKLCLLKTLSLLLQSQSLMKKCGKEERTEMIGEVKKVFLSYEGLSLEQLKEQFLFLLVSLREDLLPPRSIFVPFSTLPLTRCVSSYKTQADLEMQTRTVITKLQQAANSSLQRRLLEEDSYDSQDDEEDWEGMQQVWKVWLEFPAKSDDQLAVWEETLLHCENLDSLLWNLTFYLSMEEDVDIC